MVGNKSATEEVDLKVGIDNGKLKPGNEKTEMANIAFDLTVQLFPEISGSY